MISNYSFFDINADTLNIALAEAIQFGRTLWRYDQQNVWISSQSNWII